MTLRRSFRPLRPDLDKFLFAAVGDEIDGIQLSMISALTRLGLDPRQEAHRLSSLSSREAVEQLLRDILQEEAKKIITIDQIQKRVAEHFDVRLADMTSKRRPANIAFPRQVAMFLARRHTKASLNEIGDAFGGRDHGTVLHACKAVSMRMKNEEQIRLTMAGLATRLDRE